MELFRSTCTKPLVSVICTAYQHEKYLTKTLNSLIHQNTSFEYEVLVHDDASTDNTQNIIKEFYKLYPNKVTALIETENQYSKGISIVNEIIQPYIRGKYIAFCEGDDYWTDENKLQLQVDFLEANTGYSGSTHCVVVVDNDERSQYTIREVQEDCDIVELNPEMDFPQTSSFVFRNPWYPDYFRAEITRNMKGWDKNYAIYMIYTGKVRHLKAKMSCYRHVKNMGTSSEARENLYNLTSEKIVAEMDLYYQLVDYGMLKKSNDYYADHYYKNVTLYSIKKLLKKPSIQNMRKVVEGIKKSPYHFYKFFNFILKRLKRKINGKSKKNISYSSASR